MLKDILILSTGEGMMNIMNPTPEQVDTADMLRNLSRMRRFCGASPMTVLQHSLYVGALVGLRGYVHDLHEYVTGDIPSPLLDVLCLPYRPKPGTMHTNGMPDSPYGTISLKRIQGWIQFTIRMALAIPPEAMGDGDLIFVADRESCEIERLLIADTTGEYRASLPYEVRAILDLTPEQAIDMFRAKLAEFGVDV